MLDKIGIIGSTQGVNDSNNPATKKPAITSHKLPLFNAEVVLSSLKPSLLSADAITEPLEAALVLAAGDAELMLILKFFVCGA